MKSSMFRTMFLITAVLPALAAAQGGPPPAVVRVAEVRLAELAPSISVPGTVISRNDASLSAEVDGQLLWVAEIGTEIPAGEPVARIEDALRILQREEFRGIVASLEAREGFLSREADRLARLAADNNAAKNRLDEVETELQSATSDLAVARSRLRQADLQLERTRVRAPFTGIVTQRMSTPGEHARAGDEVVRLVDPDQLEVVARAPLTSLRHVAAGSTLAIQGERHGGPGVIRTLVPFGDTQSHMFELRIDVAATDWRVGESVRVAVPSAAPEQVLAVPRDALVLRRDGASVFRITAEGTAERIEVIPGLGAGELVGVTGRLAPGDRVIIRGAERLREGQPLTIVEG